MYPTYFLNSKKPCELNEEKFRGKSTGRERERESSLLFIKMRKVCEWNLRLFGLRILWRGNPHQQNTELGVLSNMYRKSEWKLLTLQSQQKLIIAIASLFYVLHIYIYIIIGLELGIRIPLKGKKIWQWLSLSNSFGLKNW